MTKPRVILLLEVPTLAAMLIAGEGWPAPLLVGATLLGGALAAGGRRRSTPTSTATSTP